MAYMTISSLQNYEIKYFLDNSTCQSNQLSDANSNEVINSLKSLIMLLVVYKTWFSYNN